MIYRYLKFLLIITIGTVGPVLSVSADSLGTLFTTSEDRQKLETIRNRKEAKKEKVIAEEKDDPIANLEVKKEIILRNPIALKGIVHRSSGKSTAWVNEGNTFEGSLDSEFIDVPSENIKPDQITIIMSDDNSEFNLKVGEVYTPAPIEKEYFDSEDSLQD